MVDPNAKQGIEVSLSEGCVIVDLVVHSSFDPPGSLPIQPEAQA